MSIVLLLIFLVLTALGVPLATGLGIASAVSLLAFTHIPLSLVAQSMYSSMNSFIMVAVPLFILAGILMDEGGVAARIFDFANGIVGWVPGGLGQVTIISSVIFAGISGSSVADVASVGAISIKEMTRNGYPKEYATNLALNTSVLATIIPPSILMVVAGSVANESIGRMLIGGVVPGILIAIVFMIYNHIYCRRHGLGTPVPFSLKAMAVKTIVAIPALLAPAILLGGILFGYFTPTEAAAIAVLYTLLVATLVYRNVKWRQVPSFFYKTAKMTGTILFIAVTAKMAGWIFEFDGLPARIAKFLGGISTNQTVIMVLIFLFLVLVGMFMDATASLFILIPILLPTVKAVGINPIQFLVVMVITLALGLVTPPVGVCLFAVSNLTGLSLEKVTKASIGLMSILAAAILVIAVVPGIILVPLKWFGM